MECLPLDRTGPIGIEEAEGNLVLGIRLREQVLEGSPFVDVDSTGPAGICDSEKDSIVFTLDLVLFKEKIRSIEVH